MQYIALILAGYVVGSVRLTFNSQRLTFLVRFALASAFALLVRLSFEPLTGELAPREALVVLLAALAFVIGQARPLPALFGRVSMRSVSIASALGLGGTLLATNWYRPGVLLASAFGILVLVGAKSARRWAYVLPLVALIPVGIQYAGFVTRAKQAAYVLLVIFLALEVVRVLKPGFNRWLIARWPSLFPESQRVRPLGASGAVTATAILVHLLPPEQALVASLFGVIGISVAEALNTLRPVFTQKIIKGTTRGFALYLFLTLVALLPAAIFLGRTGLFPAALVALSTLLAAIIPSPLDRYLLATLVAGAGARGQ